MTKVLTRLCVVGFGVFPLLGQFAAPPPPPKGTVSQFKWFSDPSPAKVRPFENIALQLRAYGQYTPNTGDKREGRLQRAITGKVSVKENGGGWLSKPFKYQDGDNERLIDQGDSLWGNIFSRAVGDFLVQDAVLYTAPDKPGKYTVQIEQEGKKAEIVVEVASDAPSKRKKEKTDFPPEAPSTDPYYYLAAHWSPFLAQETWWQPKSDFPTRFDFDGDWKGDDNWDDMEEGSSQAYVYYAVMETATHWFLIYNAFHPRDYSDKCVVGTCHENDNEGLILTILKDGTDFGKLQVMETLAHNNVYSYIAERGFKGGLHTIEGEVQFYDRTHPAVFIESGGHGIYGAGDNTHSRYKLASDSFNGGTGATFVWKGVAERPKHANDRFVGYELLPILEHWWARATSESGLRESTFDEYLPYVPFGGRPGISFPQIGSTFYGRKQSQNKAKPFWGWHDTRTLKAKVVGVGQWGLDPAYSVSRNLTFPAEPAFALDYVYNPYLGIDTRNGAVTKFPEVKPPSAVSVSMPAGNAQPSAGNQILGSTPPAQPVTETESILPRILPSLAAAAPSGALPVTVRRSANWDDAAAEGHAEIKIWVDGSAVVYVQQDRAYSELKSGQPVREAEAEFTQPLAQSKPKSIGVEKVGRGTVKLIEEPSVENGWTAKIQIDDPQRGGDKYTVRVSWVN